MAEIGVYLPSLGRQTSMEETRVVEQFIAGFSEHGTSVEVVHPNQTRRPFPIAVMFGWGKLRHHEILREQHKIGGKTLVINFGSLRRDEGYYTVGWNGLNGRANYFNQESPEDRWEVLGIDLKPWRDDGQHILVAGQVPTDGAVSSLDIVQWCEEQVIQLKCLSQREIVFRPHPLARDISRDIYGARRSEQSLSEDLKAAWAVVTYNSTSSSMSVIDGIPVFTFDRGSMAWEVSNHDLTRIEDPEYFQRAQWAYNLAYTQWTLDEIRHGLAWNHLKRGAL